MILILFTNLKEVIIADCLSRAPAEAKDDNLMIPEVNTLDELAISYTYKMRLLQASNEDQHIQMLRTFIHDGWPKYTRDVPSSLKPYYGYRTELSEKDGVIFKGDQILVPIGLRNYTKQRLHTSHLGPESNIRRAKSLCFWPGMKNELETIYLNCKQQETF